MGVLFVLNAVAFANVVPRLPAIKQNLALSNTALGTAVAATPVGALLSGTSAGWLVHRVTSRRVAVVCGIGFGLVLPFFSLASSWFALAAAFFALGVLDSLMDVSMNAHALRVQRAYGRSIINGLHGMWSIGAVLGGLLGTAAIAAGITLRAHLLAAGIAVVAAAVASNAWLLGGNDDDSDRGTDAEPEDRRRSDATGRRAGRRRLAVLGLVVVMAGIVEDAPRSWGAVLLHSELGASAPVAGLVFLAFTAAMTLSRLVGDRLVERFGAAGLTRVGGAITAVGVGGALLVGKPALVIAGFALAGAGTALLFPLAFDAAGRVPGVATGHGVGAVAWLARLGFLLAAPLIGAVGDAISLRVALCVVPAAGVVIALLAGTMGPGASTRPVGP